MMMQNMYDIERIIQLDQLARDEQMRHKQHFLARQDKAQHPFTRMAFVMYLLTLFGVS